MGSMTDSFSPVARGAGGGGQNERNLLFSVHLQRSSNR